MATEPGRPATSRLEAAAVTSVTAAFGVLLVVWALITPMFQAPDEVVHVDAAVTLTTTGEWAPAGEALFLQASQAARDSLGTVPRDARPSWGDLLAAHPGTTADVNQMTQHPPTYYALAGAVLDAVDFTHHRWDLGVLALRLLSVALVAPLPLLTWATVRRLTRSPRTAIVAATTLLAVPQLAQIGSSVTSDAPIILLGAVTVWLTTRTLTGDQTWRTHLALGTALGLALATKGTAFPAIPFVALAVLLGDTTHPLARRALRTLAVGATTAALGAWWWIHNLTTTGTLQPNGLPRSSTPNPWPAGEGPDLGFFLDTEWSRLSSSFWGQFGRLEYPMTPILTDVLTVGCLALVAGWAFRGRRSAARSWLLASFPLITLLVLLHNNFDSYDRTQEVSGAQGRYLFGSLVALATLLAVAGLRLVTHEEARRRVGRSMVVAAPLVGAYGASVAYRGFFEQSDLEVTRPGLANLLVTTPVGGPALLAAMVVLALVAASAGVATWRLVGRAGPPVPAPVAATPETAAAP